MSTQSSNHTMTRLVLELVRPYRAWLIVVIIAMLVETAMSMAGPWPLKVVIDNVLGHTRCRIRCIGSAIYRWPRARWDSRASRPSA